MTIASLKYQKGSYLAFVLDEASREKLLELFPPSFSKVICHHVTIIAGVSAGQLSKYQAAHKTDPNVFVTGFVKGTNVECFTAAIDGETRRKFGDGGLYHVTHSVEPPAKPVDSNKMLKDFSTKVDVFEAPIELTGEFTLVKQ